DSASALQETVECDEEHGVEVYHVGTFTGGVAERTTAPAETSTEFKAAVGECDTEAKDYLGDDWRAGNLQLGVVLPSEKAWSGGGRGLRCELSEIDTVANSGDAKPRSGSMRDGLAGDRPLALGCYTVTSADDEIDSVDPIACDQQHDAEYAGVWAA